MNFGCQCERLQRKFLSSIIGKNDFIIFQFLFSTRPKLISLYICNKKDAKPKRKCSELLHSKPTTQLHLVPRSRVHGVILLLPQYAFMAWCSIKAHGQLFTFNLSLLYYGLLEATVIL